MNERNIIMHRIRRKCEHDYVCVKALSHNAAVGITRRKVDRKNCILTIKFEAHKIYIYLVTKSTDKSR